MCIRDSLVGLALAGLFRIARADLDAGRFVTVVAQHRDHHVTCLLYTSDAADERSSVDLGGRRIIKKKKTEEHKDL